MHGAELVQARRPRNHITSTSVHSAEFHAESSPPYGSAPSPFHGCGGVRAQAHRQSSSPPGTQQDQSMPKDFGIAPAVGVEPAHAQVPPHSPNGSHAAVHATRRAKHDTKLGSAVVSHLCHPSCLLRRVLVLIHHQDQWQVS